MSESKHDCGDMNHSGWELWKLSELCEAPRRINTLERELAEAQTALRKLAGTWRAEAVRLLEYSDRMEVSKDEKIWIPVVVQHLRFCSTELEQVIDEMTNRKRSKHEH